MIWQIAMPLGLGAVQETGLRAGILRARSPWRRRVVLGLALKAVLRPLGLIRRR
jgi:hypothetical protein